MTSGRLVKRARIKTWCASALALGLSCRGVKARQIGYQSGLNGNWRLSRQLFFLLFGKCFNCSNLVLNSVSVSHKEACRKNVSIFGVHG